MWAGVPSRSSRSWWRRSANGRLARAEQFEVDDEAGALAYLAELQREAGAADAPATTRERLDSYVAAWNARDWDRLREIYAPDVRLVDRRLIGWGELQGPDAIIEVIRGTSALALDARLDLDVLASGERGAICRQTVSGHAAEGGGEFEVELFSVSTTEDGFVSYLEIFDETGLAAAYERFEEVGAATEPERAYVRLARLVNARDWEAFEDCFTDDSELVDRRSLAWETIAGAEGNVEMQRSWVELVPDIEIRLDVLASDDEHIALRWTGVGHAADGGGAVDYAGLVVANVRERHVAHAEIFDRDDEEGALARFEELRSPVEPPPRVSPMRALLERYEAAYNARDWRGMQDVFAPDIHFLDRRLVAWGEFVGRDAFIESLQGQVELARDLTLSTVLVASGASAGLVRHMHRGHFEEGGGEIEIAALVLNRVESGRERLLRDLRGQRPGRRARAVRGDRRADRTGAGRRRGLARCRQRARLGCDPCLLSRTTTRASITGRSAGSRCAGPRRWSTCTARG